MKDAGLSCGHVCDEPSREQARGPAGRRVKTSDSCFNAPCSIHTDREIQDWPTACTGESVQLAPFVGKTPFSPSTLLPCPALFCVCFLNTEAGITIHCCTRTAPAPRRTQLRPQISRCVLLCAGDELSLATADQGL